LIKTNDIKIILIFIITSKVSFIEGIERFVEWAIVSNDGSLKSELFMSDNVNLSDFRYELWYEKNKRLFGKMKISIITVCYNSASTIKKTIESVLSQTCDNIEYILVDGDSIDGTLDIIKEYEPKFNGRMKWICEKDNGLYDAMNKGIKIATGDIIAILNSDDYYSNINVLEKVAEKFKDSNFDIVYGNILYIQFYNKPYRYWKSGKSRTFKYGWMPPHPAFFVRKSVYEKYGLYRLDCGVNADYEMMLRLLEKNKLKSKWINEIFVHMNAGGTSNSGLKSRIDAFNDNNMAWSVNSIKKLIITNILKRLRKTPQYFMAIFYHYI
jgi:glycosyltransferase involved in cell wall biosynthesis